jgi:hypothetical protein
MATVNAVVYDQFKRENGTFHVQIVTKMSACLLKQTIM